MNGKCENWQNGTGGKKLDGKCENWQKWDRWKEIGQKIWKLANFWTQFKEDFDFIGFS